MRTLNVELITPERTFLSTKAEFVVLPGISGDLGILPGHISLTTLLKPGAMKLDIEGVQKRLIISTGIARVEPEFVKVFSPVIRYA